MFSKTIKGFAIAMVAIFAVFGSAQAAKTIKIGAVAPKTGPLAGGAAVSHWPNIQLWAETINGNGGMDLKGKKYKVEIIEYDDTTNPGETVKAVQRLIDQDKVDFIIAPYGTGFNLAAGPILNKNGFPHIAVTAISDKGPELAKRWGNSFWTLGSSTAFASSVANVLKEMRDTGKIGNRVAMVNVGDAFGIELANAGRPALKAAGFDIVYDESYPLGTQDLSPLVKGAKDANPDAFVAWSYPPDTFGLTAQAKVVGLNVKAFYVGVGTSFPVYKAKFGSAVNGVLGAGGVNPDTPAMKAYREAHLAVTGKEADYWASPVVYASLEILQQAIEGVGKVDRAAVVDYIKSHTFDTVIGPVNLSDQINHKYWTVGQWQSGKFYGVESTGMPGSKKPLAKIGW